MQWRRQAELRPGWWLVWLLAAMPWTVRAELASMVVQRGGAQAEYVAEGAVEAVRASVLAAQTTGRITALSITAGERVVAGQVLARIDERIAADQLAASRAQLDAARNEYERSKNLFEKQYISKAAMDRAEAQYKALRAQAASTATQTQLHTIIAPYAGVIASVDIELGDMALPGKTLLTMYAPEALRVIVQVPEGVASNLLVDKAANLEIPALQREFAAAAIELLPTRDATAHTCAVRLPLPKTMCAVFRPDNLRARICRRAPRREGLFEFRRAHCRFPAS